MKSKTAWAIIGGAILVLGILVYFVVSSEEPSKEDEVISRNGIHFHPHLSLVIQGEAMEIPTNIGLEGPKHNPVHTHQTDGIIHLEYSGVVTQKDTKLFKFFEIWGKRFDKECILEYCNGPDGTVKMFVNGEENKEFGDYHMKDTDKIEIRFE